MTNPFEEILSRLDRIERIMLNHETRQPVTITPDPEKYLTIAQASDLLNLKIGTLYQLVHKGQLPNYKRGKHLSFKENELRQWMQAGRRQTMTEIQTEAINALSKH
ncbi:MAG: helix-turn-helix domain-containing protein [Bacteroidetes bacterium]|nr:helix-turn-helix domain-containing protein [Bacteroidota bacterium]